jgi:hypothetical protein
MVKKDLSCSNVGTFSEFHFWSKVWVRLYWYLLPETKFCLNQTHQISSSVCSVISRLPITGPRQNDFKKIKEWISGVERLSQVEAYESSPAVLVGVNVVGLHIASV